MYLLSGAHFFNPPNLDESDETFLPRVLINQIGFFGLYPERLMEIAGSMMTEGDALKQAVAASGGERRFQRTLAQYFRDDDLEFLFAFMKIDPGDRPSAKKLLQSQWVNNLESSKFKEKHDYFGVLLSCFYRLFRLPAALYSPLSTYWQTSIQHRCSSSQWRCSFFRILSHCL
jgi:hypothetical protein